MYLKVHEQVQELKYVPNSFPALCGETFLVGWVLQRHDNQRVEEPTEHEEVVNKKVAPDNEKQYADY